MPPSASATPSSAPSGTMEGMGGMMEGMGSTPDKELTPSLMDIPTMPPVERAQVERRARERMQTSLARMSGAVVRLAEAASGGSGDDAESPDYAAMEAAAAETREALAQFETGIAARRALENGQAPQSVALRWFKREMDLSPRSSGPRPLAVFGLRIPPFHLIALVTLAAFAAVMAAIYLFKVRRASALLSSLPGSGAANASRNAAPTGTGDRGQAPATPATPATPSGAWSGQLRVARIFDETVDVKTFRLALPQGGGDLLPFTFEPGQFLTVGVRLGGKTVKRSYSIASSPCCRGWCELTVKHAPQGIVSGHLHERVREGDLLEVSGPYGRFTFRGTEASDVVFIAGGVGITPLMSAIRYLTDQSWPGDIFLVYACGRREDIIFREEIDYLRHRHPNLHVTLTLSREESPDWPGPRGHITGDLLQSAVPGIAARRVHLCGPPPMMEAVKAVLIELGVRPEQVRTEAFLGPQPRRPPILEAAPTDAGRVAVCTFARSGKTAPLTAEKTVLEASEEVGADIEYSCRQGYCGVCKTRLLAGRVTMEIEDALTPEDRTGNIILACQARSTGDVAVDA